MEVDGGNPPHTQATDSARSIVLAMDQGQNWTDAVRASLASTPHNERTGVYRFLDASKQLTIRNGREYHTSIS